MLERHTDTPSPCDSRSPETIRVMVSNWAYERTPHPEDIEFLEKTVGLRETADRIVRATAEFKARNEISKAIRDDLAAPQPVRIPQEEIAARAAILESAIDDRERLTLIRRDTLTNEPYTVTLMTDGSQLVAEKRFGSDRSGLLVSQSRLNSDGTTSLTLNYALPRYEERKANPAIFGSDKYPQAALTAFDQLFASVRKDMPGAGTNDAPFARRWKDLAV